VSGVVVINHVTFDGVTQAPGRPAEARRGAVSASQAGLGAR
jgi:hypothetical protein